MNTTESLDGAGKSLDLSSVTGETAITGDTSVTENKRRRLVRGAVAFAPLVLTLRSGALAAASCTGTKVLSVSTNGEGMFTDPSGSVGAGDYCVEATTCGPEHPTKIKTIGAMKDPIPITGPLNSDKFQCGVTGQRTVAILSSTSAGSLT